MTTLPIDFASRPWKPKYIQDETLATNKWMVFGTYPDGSVGICDGDNDILINVPPAAAERIVSARNAFVDVLLHELNDGADWGATT